MSPINDKYSFMFGSRVLRSRHHEKCNQKMCRGCYIAHRRIQRAYLMRLKEGLGHKKKASGGSRNWCRGMICPFLSFRVMRAGRQTH